MENYEENANNKEVNAGQTAENDIETGDNAGQTAENDMETGDNAGDSNGKNDSKKGVIKTGRHGEIFPDDTYVINGKPLSEWLKDDDGKVDYSRAEFGKNISNTKGYVVFDMGEFVVDPEVCTDYVNGVDMIRLAGAAYNADPYDDRMDMITPYDGEDVYRIFMLGMENPTLEDFILNFFKLINGNVYISRTTRHVYVTGNIGPEDAWNRAVDTFRSHMRRKEE